MVNQQPRPKLRIDGAHFLLEGGDVFINGLIKTGAKPGPWFGVERAVLHDVAQAILAPVDRFHLLDELPRGQIAPLQFQVIGFIVVVLRPLVFDDVPNLHRRQRGMLRMRSPLALSTSRSRPGPSRRMIVPSLDRQLDGIIPPLFKSTVLRFAPAFGEDFDAT